MLYVHQFKIKSIMGHKSQEMNVTSLSVWTL